MKKMQWTILDKLLQNSSWQYVYLALSDWTGHLLHLWMFKCK